MDEHLQLYPVQGHFPYGGYLVKGQLPGQVHPDAAQVRIGQGCLGAHGVGLGGNGDGHGNAGLPECRDEPQVGNYEAIRPVQAPGLLHYGPVFIREGIDIQGNVGLFPPPVEILDCLPGLLGGEIAGEGPEGIACQAEIYGVCSVLGGPLKLLPVSRRGQELRLHQRTSADCLSSS